MKLLTVYIWRELPLQEVRRLTGGMRPFFFRMCARLRVYLWVGGE